MLPAKRCALTTPFHPYLKYLGGIFSVALSVGSRLPGITWLLALRSPDFPLFLKSDYQASSSEVYTFKRSKINFL